MYLFKSCIVFCNKCNLNNKPFHTNRKHLCENDLINGYTKYPQESYQVGSCKIIATAGYRNTMLCTVIFNLFLIASDLYEKENLCTY